MSALYCGHPLNRYVSCAKEETTHTFLQDDEMKPKEKKSRDGDKTKTREDGEWSEDELERKRKILLEQLAEEHQ